MWLLITLIGPNNSVTSGGLSAFPACGRGGSVSDTGLGYQEKKGGDF